MRVTFIVAILLAHIALYISFIHKPISFWTSFSIALAILIIYALIFERMSWKMPKGKDWIIGIVTGSGLYLLFFIGKHIMLIVMPSLIVELENLYTFVKPDQWWHYLALFLIIIPGEELFWRGFIFQRLLKMKLTPLVAIIVATVLYTSANFYAGSLLLLLATLIAGIVWSIVYDKTKNIGTVLLSHMIFDLLLLVIFPLL